MKTKDAQQSAELEELKEQVNDLQKENRELLKKAEKFSEAAHETASLKDKLQVFRQQLKEVTAEFD